MQQQTALKRTCLFLLLLQFIKTNHSHSQPKTAPVSYFLKKAAGLPKGGQTPGREIAGKVTEAQVREIAEAKMKDLNAVDMDGAMNMVRGSARAMGLQVVEG